MSRYDLAVVNGTVVLPYTGTVRCDIGIRGGRVAALTDAIDPSQAAEVIDARHRLVFPGAVDSHFHLGIYRSMSEDTASETRSALAGGVTTVISYFRTGQHYLNKSGPYREIFPEVLRYTDGRAYTDYGFHIAVMTNEQLEEVDWLVRAQGVASFKYYMFYKGLNLTADSTRGSDYTMSDAYDLGHLYLFMQQVAAAAARYGAFGRISLSLHCEHAELIRVFIEEVRRAGPGGHVADEGPVDVVDGEPQRAVEPDGRLVRAVHVEHADAQPPAGEVLEAGEGEGTSEPEAMEGRVDGDHVDLAHRRALVGGRVHLGPAEPGQCAVVLGEQEALRVEPRLLLPGPERLEIPPALLGMGGEGPVVDRQPALLVPTDHERPGGEVVMEPGGERSAHLVERPARVQAGAGGELLVGHGGLEHPPVDVAAPLVADDVQRGVQQLGADGQRLVPVMGVDHELESPRVVAPRQLRIGHRVGVPGLPGDEAGEAGPAAVDQVEPGVVADRLVPVGPLGGVEQLGDDGHVVGGHLPLDLQEGHGRRLGR